MVVSTILCTDSGYSCLRRFGNGLDTASSSTYSARETW